MKNIVIVGGGTAGWLSALFLKRKYPIYNVTLIESTVIGILGAGEGGTPNLKSIIVDYFGFDENEFLEKVNGTKKYGIIFDKWHKDLNHSFVKYYEQSNFCVTNDFAFAKSILNDYNGCVLND